MSKIYFVLFLPLLFTFTFQPDFVGTYWFINNDLLPIDYEMIIISVVVIFTTSWLIGLSILGLCMWSCDCHVHGMLYGTNQSPSFYPKMWGIMSPSEEYNIVYAFHGVSFS